LVSLFILRIVLKFVESFYLRRSLTNVVYGSRENVYRDANGGGKGKSELLENVESSV
jgi:hypothetical protein